MKRILIVVLIGLAFYSWYMNDNGDAEVNAASYGNTHDDVIMYSLTTCGFCKAKAMDLHSEGIEFKEYYIDRDTSRRTELNEKLARAGFPARTFGVPILDVHGVMLPDNPPLSLIKEHLSY